MFCTRSFVAAIHLACVMQQRDCQPWFAELHNVDFEKVSGNKVLGIRSKAGKVILNDNTLFSRIETEFLLA